MENRGFKDTSPLFSYIFAYPDPTYSEVFVPLSCVFYYFFRSRHHPHRHSASNTSNNAGNSSVRQQNFLKRSELAQSVMSGVQPNHPYVQKQHQYYSPQVRRKSVDLPLQLQNIRECPHEISSDSSDEDQTILVASDQLSALSVVQHHNQQKKAGNSNVNPMQQQQPMLLHHHHNHAKSSKSRQISSQQPAYYGGVHPVYLPNSRLKAKKLQKLPPPMTSTTVLPDYPGISTNNICQGCCQHHNISAGGGNACCSLSNNVKSGEDNKKCIIS